MEAFVLLAVVLIVVILIFGLIDSLRDRRPRVDQPSCGGCRYAVAGLERMVCPECGGDFRKVGIVTSAMRFGARTSAPVGALCWVFLSVILWVTIAVVSREENFLYLGALFTLFGLAVLIAVWIDLGERQAKEHGAHGGAAASERVGGSSPKPGVDSAA